MLEEGKGSWVSCKDDVGRGVNLEGKSRRGRRKRYVGVGRRKEVVVVVEKKGIEIQEKVLEEKNKCKRSCKGQRG